MTAKFDAFKAELIELCNKHLVTLATTRCGVPAIYARGAMGDGPIYMGDLEDCTDHQPRQEVTPPT